MPVIGVCVICGADTDAAVDSDYCRTCSKPARKWRCQGCGRWFDAEAPGSEPECCIDCSH